jgi:acetylornithine deacetylase/succinyl-diaminopimelate desuccinylase-like protein
LATSDTLRSEAIRHLQTLLRVDTTNPPGNETAAAEYIAAACRAEGIEAEVLESAPGRGNVVARLRAERPTGRPVLLLGHTDVVGVEREQWTRDPFGGELVDDWLWGRGALDMKSQVAGELAAFLELKRQGVPLTRDVILAAVADEETGGEFGAAWLWQHHRDLIDAEYAINEGGGTATEIGGHRFYLCQAGEKGASRLRIVARGEPGHASVPLDDTAMKRLGEALVRLHAWEPETTLTAPMRQMLQTMAGALGGEVGGQIEALLVGDTPTWEQLRRLPLNEAELAMLRASTRNTAVPTLLHGGHRINVIPSEVTLDLDGRILPGVDPDEWRDAVQAVVGDDVAVELMSRESGIAADPASPFFDAIGATMAGLDPSALVVPYLLTGGTDAAHLPDIKVYGYFPFEPTDRIQTYAKLIHGHDERIHVDDLAFGTRFVFDVVRRFCAAG